jgi:carboxylesterase type B
MFGWMGGMKYVSEYGTINLGIEDQKTAIEWVSKEIARFGGSNKK